jgi:hypothetical protein
MLARSTLNSARPMLILPDPRPLAALTRPGLMAFLASICAILALEALARHTWALAVASAAVFLVVTFLGWTGSVVRRDAIRDTATSTAGGAALGYVELLGQAQSAAQHVLRSQIRKRNCVWYRYLIEQRVGGAWVVQSGAASEDCFLLRDSTGDCVVDPEGAEIIPRNRRVWREFDQRFHELWIEPGERLYVLGEVTSVPDTADSSADLSQDVSSLLSEWKHDQQDLLRRYDLDSNGALDKTEWEQVRHDAQATVEREYRSRRALGPVNVIRKPRDGRRYLISAYEPAQLARRFALWAWLHLVLLVAGCMAILLLTGTIAWK